MACADPVSRASKLLQKYSSNDAIVPSGRLSPTRVLMGNAPIPFALLPGSGRVPLAIARASLVSQLRSMVKTLSEEEHVKIGPTEPISKQTAETPSTARRVRPKSAKASSRVPVSNVTTSIVSNVTATAPREPSSPRKTPLRRRRTSVYVSTTPASLGSSTLVAESRERSVYAVSLRVRSPRRSNPLSPTAAVQTPPSSPSKARPATAAAVTRKETTSPPRFNSQEPIVSSTLKPPRDTVRGVGVKYLIRRKGSVADRSHDSTFVCLGPPDQSSEIAKALVQRGWTDIRYAVRSYWTAVLSWNQHAALELLHLGTRLLQHTLVLCCYDAASCLIRKLMNFCFSSCSFVFFTRSAANCPKLARFVWALDDSAVTGDLLDDSSRIVNHFQGSRCITTKVRICFG